MNGKPDPSFHSFLLTREDGSRVYGCALTFFEKVENENICAAMLTLSNMYDTEQSSPRRLEHMADNTAIESNSGPENDADTGEDSIRYGLICFLIKICIGLPLNIY